MRNWCRCVSLMILLLCSFAATYGQTIRVVDEYGDAIYRVSVLVYSEGTYQQKASDINGFVSIEDIPNIDSVYLTHTAYQDVTLTYSELKKLRFKVEMETMVFVQSAFIFRHNPDLEKQKDQVTKLVSIKPREVKFQNPQTAADMIALSNQVYVQKSQMGGGSPMIRGFAANNVLIVVDGVRMNNAIFRDGNLQNIISVDPHLIKTTDIVFGPGSVIYGSDAMGGVMAFETRTPDVAGKKYYLGNVMLRTSSANKENSWHVDLAYGNKGKFSGLSSITLSNYGDLRMGNDGPSEYTRPIYTEYNGSRDTIIPNDDPNVQYFTSYSQVNFNQKVRYKPDSLNDFVLHLGYTTSSPIPRYDRLIQFSNNQPRYGDWYYGPQRWTQINGRYLRRLPKSKWADKLVSTLAYQHFQESRNVRRFQSDNLETNREDVDVYSLNIDLDKEFGKTDLMYGLELVANTVHSEGIGNQVDSGFNYDIATRYPDGSTMNTGAVYLSVKRKIRNKWLVSAGGRYSYIELQAPFTNSFYDFPFDEISLQKSALSGSAGLRYLLTKRSFVFANIATGFRAPNVDDMGKIFDSQPNRVIVPNPELQPEYSYSSEVGIHAFLKGNIELMVNGYYTIIDNIIVREDYSIDGKDSLLYQGEMLRMQSLVNSDEGHVYGVEAKIKIPLNKELDFSSSFNYISGSTASGQPLRHVSPNFGQTSLSWSHSKYKLRFYSNYNMELSNEDLAPTEQTKTHIYAKDINGLPYSPAWFTVNVKGGISFSKALTLNLGLENILNKRYRPYSSGISAPGRNLIISLYGRF